MILRDYLKNLDSDELTNRLIKLDASIMALHHKGFYIVSMDANNIKLYDNEITLESFNDKLDYLDSGINTNGDLHDILELCAIGICAYNNFDNLYINQEFIAYLTDNLDDFKKNIPSNMYDYYYNVLVMGNIDYLNNYLFRKEYNLKENDERIKINALDVIKSTNIGTPKEEAGYAMVLSLPLLFALAYMLVLGILWFF